MPTKQIQPGAEELQDVASAVLKARKVVVVTGAGISTNSGIPDFRSENGLYSLIQAQFEAAARQDAQSETPSQGNDKPEPDASTGDENTTSEPPQKRRRISRDSTERQHDEVQDEIRVELKPQYHEVQVQDEDTDAAREETIVVQPVKETSSTHPDALPSEISPLRETICAASFVTPQRKPHLLMGQPTTSPLSSPPPEDALVPPSVFQRHRRLIDVAMPLSSSPLSSPPPVLFDPFETRYSSGSGSDGQSSTSLSEVDETPPSSNAFSSSQSSVANRSSLPYMKGKDLFDASIWSDPVRTSVFYTFATSLRQKVRDVTPTVSHRFISHLRDRGKLVRCYTQNIDQIEEKVGLSTSLEDGPGGRGRFSRRTTANMAQLSAMVEEASAEDSKEPIPCGESQPKTEGDGQDSTRSQATEGDAKPAEPTANAVITDDSKTAVVPKSQRSGVECVFLHGSLDLLRCFRCGGVCPWDGKELETLSGHQPECPHCVGATVAREEKGKRALGVGKLRPDIVLYGEEHPNAHLISPIITHDLALYPDLLLILGTSLRVHGLKVMVREFAKAVHSKGGSVIFVNFTKPPESSWGDVIDYWVSWDCDAWVSDLQERVPKLWQEPEPPKNKKKRDSNGASEDGQVNELKRPPPKNPAAIRDTKATGAYWSSRILSELHRITDTPPLMTERRASLPGGGAASEAKSKPSKSTSNAKPSGEGKAPKRPRKSAPGALQKPPRFSLSKPSKGKATLPQASSSHVVHSSPSRNPKHDINSILNSVKTNPRVRKRKTAFGGEEVVLPKVGRQSTGPQAYKAAVAELTLPPLSPEALQGYVSPYAKPQPLEPRSPPPGPLASISVNMRAALPGGREHAFWLEDPLMHHLMKPAEPWTHRLDSKTRFNGIKGFSLRPAPPEPIQAARSSRRQDAPPAEYERRLRSWGSSWSCSGK